MSGIRTIVTKVNPARVVILRGSLEQSNQLAKQIQAAQTSSGVSSNLGGSIKTFVPRNNESVSFLAGGDKYVYMVI
jgi:hypothetical protein